MSISLAVSKVHPSIELKSSLRKVTFSFPDPCTWIGWKDNKEGEVNAEYSKEYLAQHAYMQSSILRVLKDLKIHKAKTFLSVNIYSEKLKDV